MGFAGEPWGVYCGVIAGGAVVTEHPEPVFPWLVEAAVFGYVYLVSWVKRGLCGVEVD